MNRKEVETNHSEYSAATSDPMTSVHGLRRLLHRHRWIRPKRWTFETPPDGVFEFCGRCGKERVRPYFLVAK